MRTAAREEDLRVAREMARRIVAAAGDRVERVILFGSRARGDAHPDSDYDLLVVTDERMSREDEDRLRSAARLGRGQVPEVWTVSEEAFHATRDVVGWLSYFACYDGIVIYEREGLDGRRSRRAVG